MIINLTQHDATPAQTASGVVNLPAEPCGAVRALLTFEERPDQAALETRAARIAAIAAIALATLPRGGDHAMIGGAPYLMAPLERALLDRGITPLYAFSRRESVEETLSDGSTRKVAVFRHAGWVEVA